MPTWTWIILAGAFCAWTVLSLLGAERQRRLDAMRNEWEEYLAVMGKKARESKVPHGLTPLRH